MNTNALRDRLIAAHGTPDFAETRDDVVRKLLDLVISSKRLILRLINYDVKHSWNFRRDMYRRWKSS